MLAIICLTKVIFVNVLATVNGGLPQPDFEFFRAKRQT